MYATDIDTIQYKCNDRCQEDPLDSPWVVVWELGESGGQDMAGHFLDSSGNLVSTLVGPSSVLYLPPRGLSEGETLNATVRATVVDECSRSPESMDSPVTFEFDVEVSRPNLFDVTISEGAIIEGKEGVMPPPCSFFGSLDCCTPQGPDFDAVSGITITSIDAPTNGAPAGSLRRITVMAHDLDRTSIDCGVPPCLFVGAAEDVCDTVNYDWTLVSGGGALIPTSITDTIYFMCPASASNVVLRVVIDDGGLADDPPETRDIEFPVFQIEITDQTGQRIPQDWQTQEALQTGLTVSRVVTTDPMDGCTGSGGVDPYTYRVRFLAPQGHEADSAEVRVHTQRAAASASFHEPGTEYTNVIPVTGNTTENDIRLVSNTKPNSTQRNLHASSLYDSEVCNDMPNPPLFDQTPYVRLGDWVEFVFRVAVPPNNDPADIGFVSLPVGRPWVEPGHSLGVLTGWVNYFVTSENPAAGSQTVCSYDSQHTTHTDWMEAALFQVERISEDYAQAGIRFALITFEQNGPFLNGIQVEDFPVINQGTVSVQLNTGQGGQSTVVDTLLSPPMSAEEACEALAQSFSSQLPSVGESNFFRRTTNSWVVVVGTGNASVNLTGLSLGTTGLMALLPLYDWSSTGAANVVTVEEAFLLGVNLKPERPAQQGTIDFIGCPNRSFLIQNGLVAVTGTSELTNSDGLIYTSFVTAQGLDGWDGYLSMLMGHELTHFLLDDTAEGTNSKYLRWQPAVPYEHPEKKKRISGSEVTSMRDAENWSLGPGVLQRLSLQIPNWED